MYFTGTKQCEDQFQRHTVLDMAIPKYNNNSVHLSYSHFIKKNPYHFYLVHIDSQFIM